MRRHMEFWLSRLWYSSMPAMRLIALALSPLSWLFRSLAALSRLRFELFPPPPLPMPVVVVGNINVGGSGKTPLVIALAAHLRTLGLRPGIVSRGYGGRAAGVHRVEPDDSPQLCGDEAVLLAAHAPTVIARRRRAAAAALQGACDVVLSDDGLQHYALPRDIEIAVVDGIRGLGNGRCLPVGPLREPPRRLQHVDLIVVNGGSTKPCKGAHGMHLLPERWTRLDGGGTRRLDDPPARKAHAVAGIGAPERFFVLLRELGVDPVEHVFPDHHSYCAEDLRFGDQLPVFMTEKDAVKCRRLENAPSAHWWSLRVCAQLDETFLADFDAALRFALQGRGAVGGCGE